MCFGVVNIKWAVYASCVIIFMRDEVCIGGGSRGAPGAHAPPPNQPEVGTVPPLPEPLKPCKYMLSIL